MSKRRFKKPPFNAPSKTYEKYEHSFEKSKSDETFQPTPDEVESATQGDTDVSMVDNIVQNYNQPKWEFPLTLRIVLACTGLIGLIIAICAFFWSMNDSVVETREDISKVSEKIQIVEKAVEDVAKKDTEHHSDIKQSFVEILNKFDRILDRLPTSCIQDKTKSVR